MAKVQTIQPVVSIKNILSTQKAYFSVYPFSITERVNF